MLAGVGKAALATMGVAEILASDYEDFCLKLTEYHLSDDKIASINKGPKSDSPSGSVQAFVSISKMLRNFTG